MGLWKVRKTLQKIYSTTCMNWETVGSNLSYKHAGSTELCKTSGRDLQANDRDQLNDCGHKL